MTDGPRARARVFGLLAATGTLLGLSTNMAKVAASVGLPPAAFLAWSCLGAALLSGVPALARGAARGAGAATLRYLAIAAVVSLALPSLLLYSAIPHVGASFAALCIAFSPLFTYAGAVAMGLERLRAQRVAGVALALAGAAHVAVLKLSMPDATVGWIAAALAAPVLLAAGNVYRGHAWPPGATPALLAPGMLGMSALAMVPIAAVAGVSLRVPLADARAIGVVAAQSAVYAAQYLLFFRLQRAGGATYLSLLGAVGAVTGVPFALAFLGESPPPGLAVGGALILAGVLALTFGRSR